MVANGQNRQKLLEYKIDKMFLFTFHINQCCVLEVLRSTSIITLLISMQKTCTYRLQRKLFELLKGIKMSKLIRRKCNVTTSKEATIQIYGVGIAIYKMTPSKVLYVTLYPFAHFLFKAKKKKDLFYRPCTHKYMSSLLPHSPKL